MKTKKVFLIFALVLASVAISICAVSAEVDEEKTCIMVLNGIRYDLGCPKEPEPEPEPVRNPNCNNKLSVVADISIPDGTILVPGQSFRKTWLIKNEATCTWNENYYMTFIGGDDLGAVDTPILRYNSGAPWKYIFPRSKGNVWPGETFKVSIDLKAPTEPGEYTAYFRLVDSMGFQFGSGQYSDTPLKVDIIVDECALNYPPDLDEVAGGLVPNRKVEPERNGLTKPICITYDSSPCCQRDGVCDLSDCTVILPEPLKNLKCNNRIRNVESISIPDGMIVETGQLLYKTWRVMNGATCAWNKDYKLTFVGGDDFGFYDLSILPGDTAPWYAVNPRLRTLIYPNQYTTISIGFTAPEEPGVYESYFRITDDLGYDFGSGSYADEPLRIKITVVDNNCD